MVAKANQCLNILCALKHKLDMGTLEKLYFTFVRSKLEYANVVWDNCSQQMSDLIESVQYRAAKIVSGAIHRTSHSIVYKELGWETLAVRRKNQRLKTFHKAVIKDAPAYLQHALPPKVAPSLRNAGDYVPPTAKTTTFQNSFLQKTPLEWNLLDQDIKHSLTGESFSRKLTKDKNNVPDYFLSGNRKYNVLHARLRMLCSPLNDHLYSHIHVVDSPKCSCGHSRENTKHFLLECQLYDSDRKLMRQKLEALPFEVTLHNLLYGDKTCSSAKNKEAFGIIQLFIEKSGRFND